MNHNGDKEGFYLAPSGGKLQPAHSPRPILTLFRNRGGGGHMLIYTYEYIFYLQTHILSEILRWAGMHYIICAGEIQQLFVKRNKDL